MIWRLLLEEYGQEIKYMNGPKNVVVITLSRLPKQGDIIDDVDVALLFVKDQNTSKLFPEDCGRVGEDSNLQG